LLQEEKGAYVEIPDMQFELHDHKTALNVLEALLSYHSSWDIKCYFVGLCHLPRYSQHSGTQRKNSISEDLVCTVMLLMQILQWQNAPRKNDHYHAAV